MFDLLPKLLSSIASFLFPLFASYKALKTSDPAQLTPWLMYWSVLSCALLVEAWLEFILVWIPFYAYMRLLFLLYLVLPQTQGARHLYETYVHPYLAENEVAIEDFIASAHDRLKAAGMKYLKQAIEMLKTKVLGLPPADVDRQEDVRARDGPQGYTQALLARFSVPAARWASGGAGTSGQAFYDMLAGAVSAATGASTLAAAGAGGYSAGTSSRNVDMSASGTLIPDNIRGADEKMTFIASQREKLAFVLGALDKEAKELAKTEEERKATEASLRDSRPASMSLDGGEGASSGSLNKSRSEVDFEKIEAESGAEDDGIRQRPQAERSNTGSKGGWGFLGWGTVGTGQPSPDSGSSSGLEK